MSKYCPVCESEFEDEILICRKDKVALKKEKPLPNSLIFIDIFAVPTDIEAKKIIFYLQENGIKALENSLSISQLPVFTDMDYVVSVEKSQVEEAINLIKKAQKEHTISKDGDFITLT